MAIVTVYSIAWIHIVHSSPKQTNTICDRSSPLPCGWVRFLEDELPSPWVPNVEEWTIYSTKPEPHGQQKSSVVRMYSKDCSYLVFMCTYHISPRCKTLTLWHSATILPPLASHLSFFRRLIRPNNPSPSLDLIEAQPWGLKKAIVEELCAQILVVVDKLSTVVWYHIEPIATWVSLKRRANSSAMKVSCHYDEQDTPSFVSRLQSMEYTTDSAMSSCRLEKKKADGNGAVGE